jgi:hypothetical protein
MRLRPRTPAQANPALLATSALGTTSAPMAALEKTPSVPAAPAGHFKRGREALKRAMARAAQATPHRAHPAPSDAPPPDPLAFTRDDFDPDTAAGDRKDTYIERDLRRPGVAPTAQAPSGERNAAQKSGSDTHHQSADAEVDRPARANMNPADTPLHRVQESKQEPGTPVTSSPERSQAGSTLSSDDMAAASGLCGVLPAKPRSINRLNTGGKINTFNAFDADKPLTLQQMNTEQIQEIATHLGLPPGAGQPDIAQVLNRTMDAWRCVNFGVVVEKTNTKLHDPVSPHDLTHTHEYRRYPLKPTAQGEDFHVKHSALIDIDIPPDAIAELIQLQSKVHFILVINESAAPPSLGLLFRGVSNLSGNYSPPSAAHFSTQFGLRHDALEGLG